VELILKYFPHLSAYQARQLALLDTLYREWNTKINVISRKDIDGLYEKHVLHSLAIAKTCTFEAEASVLDIGTGGGFPGIPLAIYFPEVHFHLADSIGKKIKVVNAVKDALQLQNVTAEHTRAEDIRHPPFDYVVSRAVAPLKDLVAWSKPLTGETSGNRKPSLICLKGGDLAREIAASGCSPRLYAISSFFDEPWFKDKYVIQTDLL
jgi:16S rRNA (guanine527-N7)-methyltransferase